jgi:hypothetical protein
LSPHRRANHRERTTIGNRHYPSKNLPGGNSATDGFNDLRNL